MIEYIIEKIKILNANQVNNFITEVKKKNYDKNDFLIIAEELIKKCVALRLIKKIKNIFKEFHIQEKEIVCNEYFIHTYIASLSYHKEFKKITNFSKEINFDSLNNFKSYIIFNISRAFFNLRDYKYAIKLISDLNTTEALLQLAHYYNHLGENIKEIEIYHELKKTDISMTNRMSCNISLCDFYMSVNNKKDFNNIFNEIREDLFKIRSNKFIIYRIVKIYTYLIYIHDEAVAYNYLKYILEYPCLTDIDLEAKCEGIKLLINFYNYDKSKIIESIRKEENIEVLDELINFTEGV